MKYLLDLWQISTTPCALSEDEARQECMTRVILVIMGATTFIFTPFLFVGWSVDILTLDMPLTTTVLSFFCAVGWWLAQRGYWRLSRYIPPVIVWGIALIDTYKYGLWITNIIEYSIAIVLTVLLLNSRMQWGALWLGLGGTLVLNAIYTYSQDGAINMADCGYWLAAIGGYFIILILLLRFFTDQFRYALEQSRANSEKLMQEIYNRKQVEKELRESEEKFRTIAEQIGDVIFLTDTQGVITYVSPAVKDTFGLAPNEMQGHTFIEFLIETDISKAMTAFESAVSGEKMADSLELTMKHKDGPVFLGELKATIYQKRGVIAGTLGSIRDITKRKRMEEALRESEARFRSVFEQAAVGIAIALPNGQITDVNDKLCDILGYTRAELKTLTIRDITLPDDFETESRYAQDVLNGNRDEFNVEKRYLHKEGHTIWANMSSNVVRHENGNIKFIIGVVVDITERVRAEDALRASERRLDQMLQTLVEGMVKVDLAGEITYANRAAERILETHKFHILQRYYNESKWQQVDADGNPFPLDQLPLALALGQKREVKGLEHGIQAPDGRIKWLSVNAAPLLDEQGQLYGAIASFRDITERKQTEETLIRYREHLKELVQMRTAELQAQYNQLHAILRSVGDAIFMTDFDRRILYVNSAFTTLTGYTPAEVLGQDICALDIIADCVSHLTSIIPTLHGKKLCQGDVVIQRRDGRSYDAALTIAPVYDDTEQTTGYVFTHRDISQSKDLERARNQFITNISHQFHTPLTLLKINIYLLLGAELSEKQRQRLQSMETSVDWLIKIIKDTLEISALDSGKCIETWSQVSLVSIIGEVLDRYHKQAQSLGSVLECAPIPTLPRVMGDAGRLAQALGELVENAVVFTPAGGKITIIARVVTIEAESWVAIAVQDTGPGIAVEEQSQLFERFFRGGLAESGHTAGTGLGLSIAQKIAQAHGGYISVESTPGQGSTFTLWLRVE